MTAGCDATVQVQKEARSGFQVKRTISNLHARHDLIVLELSIYHNLLLTGSNEPRVYFFDYELFKAVGCVELPE